MVDDGIEHIDTNNWISILLSTRSSLHRLETLTIYHTHLTQAAPFTQLRDTLLVVSNVETTILHMYRGWTGEPEDVKTLAGDYPGTRCEVIVSGKRVSLLYQ